MLNSGTAKTKLVPKAALREAGWILLLLFSLGGALFTPYAYMKLSTPTPLTLPNDGTRYTLTTGHPDASEYASRGPAPKTPHHYLRAATTPQSQAKGLSGLPSLAQNQGMLFWYNEEKQHCFWMKDMHFSIDIIWLDRHKKITAIESNVAPHTYPKTFCHNGQYVIELNAGEAAKHNLKSGQELTF